MVVGYLVRFSFGWQYLELWLKVCLESLYGVAVVGFEELGGFGLGEFEFLNLGFAIFTTSVLGQPGRAGRLKAYKKVHIRGVDLDLLDLLLVGGPGDSAERIGSCLVVDLSSSSLVSVARIEVAQGSSGLAVLGGLGDGLGLLINIGGRGGGGALNDGGGLSVFGHLISGGVLGCLGWDFVETRLATKCVAAQL